MDKVGEGQNSDYQQQQQQQPKRTFSLDDDGQFSARVNREHGHFRQLFWQNKHATITYCMVFWAFGMCVAFLGPTLWDLGCQTGSTLKSMTWVFFAQSLFILIGSVMGGLLLQRFPPHNIMLFGTVVMTATLAVIPACRSETSLAVVLAIMGFHMGLIDTTANVSMLRLYGVDVSPFLQALHFFYGLGAFLSPMIAEPFLQNFDCTELIIDNATIYTTWFEQNFLENQWAEVQVNPPKTLSEAQQNIEIHHAFWIMTFLQIPVVLMTSSLVFQKRIKSALGEKMPPAEDGQYQDIENAVPDFKSFQGCTITNSKTIAVVGLASLLLFMADGMQGAFGGLIFTYIHVIIKKLSMKDAATVNAVFWGSFASGRLVAIGAALYFAPGFMLFCDIVSRRHNARSNTSCRRRILYCMLYARRLLVVLLVELYNYSCDVCLMTLKITAKKLSLGSLGAMVLLLIFRHSLAMLYIGTAIFGLFLSNVYPTTISLAEQFVRIGPSATSIIVVGAATGEMLYPVMVGNLLYKYGPDAFLAVGNITLLFMVFVFIALWISGMYSKDQKATEALLSLWLPKLFKQKPTTQAGILPDDTEITYYRRLKEDSVQSLNTVDTSKPDPNKPASYQDTKHNNGYVDNMRYQY